MKTRLLIAGLGVVLVVGVVSVVGVRTQQPAVSTARAQITKDTVERWMTELSNWGRWGQDDQIGSLNLVTPEKKRQAMALARTGTVVSLERRVTLSQKDDEIKADGKPSGLAYYEMRFRTFPKGDKRNNDRYSSDIQEFAVHGALLTHLDALCHYSWNEKLYNGYAIETVSQDNGCTKDSLDNIKEGIVTRGVLVDMSRLRTATPRDPAATRIYPEDIEAWERQTGIRISAGDALFAYNPAPPVPAGAGRGAGGARGFDLSVVPWMKTRGVAVTSGVSSIPDDGHAAHRLTLVALGTYLIDGVDLTRLAETAARLNRWEFLLVVAPVPSPGSTGFPVNPLAMF
ncbi:MAG: cyclase family protein [Vicinamibacterales bacterium]